MAKPRFVLEAGLIMDLILVAVNRLVEPNKAMSHTVQGCQRLTRPLTKRSTGGGNGNPFQYSFLENPMDGRAWWATVRGVTKSQTRLSDLTLT